MGDALWGQELSIAATKAGENAEVVKEGKAAFVEKFGGFAARWLSRGLAEDEGGVLASIVTGISRWHGGTVSTF